MRRIDVLALRVLDYPGDAGEQARDAQAQNNADDHPDMGEDFGIRNTAFHCTLPIIVAGRLQSVRSCY